MSLFRRSPEPTGYRPTDAAYDLTVHSGDRRQETALRILGHCVVENG